MSDTFTPPHGMGLRPDTPDRRDRALYQAVPNIDQLPPSADNEGRLPPVMDQGATGACTGYSGAALAYSVMVRDGHLRPFVPSPVFMYREARVLGGYVEDDGGAEIRNVWKAANKTGLPPMSILPPRLGPKDLADAQTGIFPEKSIWRRQPPPSAYADAERRQAVSYFRLDTLNDLLKCLADGWCAQVGITLFRSLYGDRGPVYDVPDPAPNERALGGHAVCAFGYDKARQRVLIRNSWGADAHEGKPNFTISFDYVRRFSSDTWSARLIEGGKPAA
ncbi:MAG: peptidase [Rubritepida sp.]|nr:peptidase [Rubritepida sp.]